LFEYVSYPVKDRNLMTSFMENVREIQNLESSLIVLKSSRDGVFCAGMDLTEFYNRKNSEIREYANLVADFWQAAYLC